MNIVNYEIANKLKNLGFEESTYHYYNIDDIRYCCDDYPSDHNGDPLREFEISAPTISQVLKWLREDKLILIGLSPMQEYDAEETIEWCATIYKADKQGGLSLKEEFYYESYEQAALAGIEYVLDNLI